MFSTETSFRPDHLWEQTEKRDNPDRAKTPRVAERQRVEPLDKHCSSCAENEGAGPGDGRGDGGANHGAPAGGSHPDQRGAGQDAVVSF